MIKLSIQITYYVEFCLDDRRVVYLKSFTLVLLLSSCPSPPLSIVFSEIFLSSARSRLKFLKALVDPTNHFIDKLK